MTAPEALARARSTIGQGCVYQLGAGGLRPADPGPWNAEHQCDCSGFVAWCLGVTRWIAKSPWADSFIGDWLETTALAQNAKDGSGAFRAVEWLGAVPGDLVVYGDSHGPDGSRHQGHVGIVSAVDATGPLAVIHCSMGNFRATGDAIRETGPGAWRRRPEAIVARCTMFVEAA